MRAIKHETGTVRDPETYRTRRRNRANKNRENNNWFGVDVKLPKEQHPPLTLQTSRRGETHYTKLWL